MAQRIGRGLLVGEQAYLISLELNKNAMMMVTDQRRLSSD